MEPLNYCEICIYIKISYFSAHGPAWSTQIDLSRTLIQLSRLPDYWALSSLSGFSLVISDTLASDQYTMNCAQLLFSAGTITIEESECDVTDAVICERLCE